MASASPNPAKPERDDDDSVQREEAHCRSTLTATDSFATLLDEAESLRHRAIDLQRDQPSTATDDAVRALRRSYQTWYAVCAELLPETLKPKFEAEYEGTRWTKKIRSFLANPVARNPFWAAEATSTSAIPLSFWTHPVERGFVVPIDEQCALLLRAQANQSPATRQDIANYLDRLLPLLTRFHAVVDQLRTEHRHERRSGFLVSDEYDVQDLLHALLWTQFDDVQAEEPSSAYAGSSTRLDFLLREARIGLEVKMPRRRSADREMGDQLLQDIPRYAARTDIDTLVFLLYDPSQYLRNPRRLEQDIVEIENRLNVIVVIVPQR